MTHFRCQRNRNPLARGIWRKLAKAMFLQHSNLGLSATHFQMSLAGGIYDLQACTALGPVLTCCVTKLACLALQKRTHGIAFREHGS